MNTDIENDNLHQTQQSSFHKNDKGIKVPTKTDDLIGNKYVEFIEKRNDELQQENKRYHMKYVDLREFSYTSIEGLMR